MSLLSAISTHATPTPAGSHGHAEVNHMEACDTSLADFKSAQLAMNSITICLLFVGVMAEVSVGQESMDVKCMMAELAEFRAGESRLGEGRVRGGDSGDRMKLFSGYWWE